jgi:hypothetical protein
MAFLDTAFDVNELPQGNTNNFEPLPSGWYTTNITQAEIKATNDGTGQYIKLRYDITGPTHQGRVVFGNLNIKNKTAKAEEIGRQQLGEIMRAIGLTRVTDTDQLIGGSLSIKLEIRPERTDPTSGKTYEASNDVKGFRSVNGSAAPMSSVPFVSPATAPAATSKASPPWAKK